MYSVNKVSSGQHKQWVLIDTVTCMPVLFATMFFLEKLAPRALGTQEKSLHALKYFYAFWYRKHEESFCASLMANNYDLSEPIAELDNFFEFLCCKQHLYQNSTDGAVHYLNLATDKEKRTNAGRVRVVIQFLRFLSRTYATVKHLDESIAECKKIRAQYTKDLDEAAETLKKVGKSGGGNERRSYYSSIPKAMRKALMVICIPSVKAKPNSRNPFTATFIQLRNDLIIRLFFNYGLRPAELLLLDTNSSKVTAPDPSGKREYVLIVTNQPEGVVDPRSREPSIKTMYSHRILSLSERDYLHLKGFTNAYRAAQFNGEHNDHGFLFTSSVAPFQPLSYETLRDIFKALDRSIDKHFDMFRDTEKYTEVPKLSPRIARHTWAYEMLEHLYKVEHRKAVDAAAHAGQVLNEKQIIANAVDKLRKLGGWSVHSDMPYHYGRRFFAQQANYQNLDRIAEDVAEGERSLEAHIESEETENIFDGF